MHACSSEKQCKGEYAMRYAALPCELHRRSEQPTHELVQGQVPRDAAYVWSCIHGRTTAGKKRNNSNKIVLFGAYVIWKASTKDKGYN